MSKPVDIRDYPDLFARMNLELAKAKRTCGRCKEAAIRREFQRKAEARSSGS